MFTYITVPIDMATQMLAYSGVLFTDLSGLITLAVGVPLGFYVIKRVISLVKAR